MLIDWFTVAAQAVNFLILVWLLKRFLYKPILSAIDAREVSLAARFAEAEAKQKEAQAERDGFQHQSKEFDLQRAGLLQAATQEADAERVRLLAAARNDADTVRSGWQDALRTQQQSLSEEIARRTRLGVFEIARKTLTELASTEIESCMSRVFIARLRGLNPAEHEQLAAALKMSPQEALVRTAFDLLPGQQAAIVAVVGELFAVHPQIRFETAPGLINGIELTANGRKVAWNITDSLASLEKDVGDLLETTTDDPSRLATR